MGFWVYLLKCADGSLGHTDDLEKRIGEHQTGACDGHTATRLPVSLVWSQEFVTREEALASERQIKGWSRAKKEALICGDWDEINRLGRGKHRHQRGITHPSTLEAMPPTLRTNGGENLAAGHSASSVRPERSAAKSKDE